MIDYFVWAEEYEKTAYEINEKVKELKRIRDEAVLTLEQRKNLNERIIWLTNDFHNHRLVAKKLRKRGKGEG